MTRGNQREAAREKNLKKQKSDKKEKDELPLDKKKARDTAALQYKQKTSEGPSKAPKETKTPEKKPTKKKNVK